MRIETPDSWGDLALESDRHGGELAQRLDPEDRADGRDW